MLSDQSALLHFRTPSTCPCFSESSSSLPTNKFHADQHDIPLRFLTTAHQHLIPIGKPLPSTSNSTSRTMDCFHDFCLACDRESTNGTYCSQACRLADLEKAASSSPTSPGLPSSSPPQQQPSSSSWASSHLGSGSGYFLPRAYKFPDQHPTSSSRPTSTSNDRQASKRQPSRQDTIDSQRSLTPSSSRTSLSSSASHSTSNSMSEQAKQELQEYFSAFHQTKASKRRQSTW